MTAESVIDLWELTGRRSYVPHARSVQEAVGNQPQASLDGDRTDQLAQLRWKLEDLQHAISHAVDPLSLGTTAASLEAR